MTRDIIVRWIPDTHEITEDDVVQLDGVQIEAHDPSDALFFDDFQWNMRQIDADDAWATGAQADPDVLVAILDTGINPTHIDLAGRVDIGLSRTFVTSSIVADDLSSFDDFNFHGTHVAGIVSTNGLGTSGVAPHATLVAVKVLSATGSGSFADVINGILYAASIPVDVINMSLGADIPNTPGNAPLLNALSEAIEEALDAGVFVVAAAGNSARQLLEVEGEGELLSVPAQSDEDVAAIAATGPVNQANFDRLASYSNFGGDDVISVGAPGGGVLGVAADFILSPCSASNIPGIPGGLPFKCGAGSFVFVAGTSQAAPHVAGLGALIDSQFGGSLDGDDLKKIIEKTSDNVGPKKTLGEGRINVFKALTGDD